MIEQDVAMLENLFFFFEFGIFVVVKDKRRGLDKNCPYRKIFKYDMGDYDDDKNIWNLN